MLADPIVWLERHFTVENVDTATLIYDEMESQSGAALAGIYLPVDPSRREHWSDCGHVLDYLHAAKAESARVLDFGPGDGWPSLRIAPRVGEVVGVDASARRVRTCQANAARLGLSNATFVHSPVGQPLPFDDASFDAIVAASSVEQTPDPQATLRELARVLRPGGRLRLSYESLRPYGNGREREAWLFGTDEGARLLLYRRDVAGEVAMQHAVAIDLAPDQLRDIVGQADLRWDGLTDEVLERLRPHVTTVQRSRTLHPSGLTLSRWLRGAGFSQVHSTHSGGAFAARLFDLTPAAARPTDSAALKAYLEPGVRAVAELSAPLDTDPMLTAVR